MAKRAMKFDQFGDGRSEEKNTNRLFASISRTKALILEDLFWRYRGQVELVPQSSALIKSQGATFDDLESVQLLPPRRPA